MTTPQVSEEEQAAAYLAWKRGEPVQFLSQTTGSWLPMASKGTAICSEDIIRRKPAPKLRPWKPEEVPVGAVIRHKRSHATRRMIIAFDPTSGEFPVISGSAGAGGWRVGELLEECDYSTDGGKTWLPCGVEETP